MPEALSKAICARLLRSDQLRRELHDLHVLSGMDALFLDALGNTLLSHPRRSVQPLFALLRLIPEGGARIQRCRQELLGNITTGDLLPGVAGLREIAHQVLLEGRTVGYWVLSAYRNPSGSPTETQQAWKEHAKAGGSTPWPQWRAAWEASPSLTREGVEAWARALGYASERCLQHLEHVDAPGSNRVLPAAVRRATELVRERFAEPLRLQDIAAEMGIRAEYLSRLFHQSTGLRFRDYLTETRLHHACQALAGSPRRVSDIAAESGFPTLSRFNQAFRAHTGLTPRSWRKRNTRWA